MSSSTHFLDTNPIKTVDEDLFNYKHYVERVKRLIQNNSSNSNPLTIGVYGKWGEGKTSFLNLLKKDIMTFDKPEGGKEYFVYDYNPWMYSTRDEMLFDFFDGLKKEFFIKDKTKFQEIGNALVRYSRYLKAIKISSSVGLPKFLNTKLEFSIDEIFKNLGEDLKGEEISISNLKKIVNDKIHEVNFKVLVFIDDLDRLDKDEIYTILKLIKLNANFENFIFIAALDEEHVSKAIMGRYGSELSDGKEFLEKIFNVPIYLPKIEIYDLRYFFEEKLNRIIESLTFNDLEKRNLEVNQIRSEFNLTSFNNPREIVKLLNSFFINSFAFEDEINLRDLFWIEYLRLKNENLYSEIKKYQLHEGINSIFNNQFDFINFNDETNDNIEFKVKNIPNGFRKTLIDKYPEHNYILDRLFPISVNDSKIIDKNKSINSPMHFEKYFSFHTERKFKVVTLNRLNNSIITKDLVEFKYNLNKIKNESPNLFTYKLFDIIDEYTKLNISHKNKLFLENRNFFCKSLFDNLDIIPNDEIDLFGSDNIIRIIEKISENLDSDDELNVEDVLKIISNLSINHLCYFTRIFKESQNKDILEKKIKDNALQIFTKENIVYESLNITVKMIMYCWNKWDESSYKNHILHSFVDLSRIKKFIRNFPPYINNKYFSVLSEENYNYIKEFINVQHMIEKISDFEPSLISNSINFNYNKSINEECTEEENLDQFIYWYNLQRERESKIESLNKDEN